MTTNSLKYGQNPHEKAVVAKLPDLRTVGQGSLSANAYLDLYAGYQVSQAASGHAVYIKHLTPLFTHDLRGGDAAFCPALLRMNEGREYGCFVYRGVVTVEIARLLLRIPAHTLAAEGFTPEAADFLAEDGIKQANRGIVLVESDIPHVKESKIKLENDIHRLMLDDVKPVADDINGKVHRILKFCRTVATNIYSGDHLVYTVCGEFDVTAGLERALAVASSNGLVDFDVATDACFGVKSPVSLLREHRVRKLFVFGEKANHSLLTRELGGSGVEVVYCSRRAFAYLP